MLTSDDSVLIVYTMPIAISNIGWKTYMINGAWDCIMIVLIAWFWVETKGKTLEELDVVFEGEKHSDVPDLELIYQGKEGLSEDVMVDMKNKSLQ